MNIRHRFHSSFRGFTIVELLIVIVVIGILAAITIVAYSGISARAKVASVQSDLTNAYQSLETYKLTANSLEQYPADLTTASLKTSPGNTFSYIVSNSANPPAYCLIADNNGTRYYVTSSHSGPTVGSSCGTFNYATNGSAESGTTCWGTATGAAYQIVNSPVYDGSSSMRAYSNGAGSDRYIDCSVPASGAGSWNISSEVYLTAAGTTDYSRGMWVNDSGSTTATQKSYNTTILNSWQSVGLTFTTPSSSTSILVRFYVMPGYDLYVDNIIVSRI